MSEGIEGSEEHRGGNSKFCKLLWHLKIQSKIKIFIWRAIHSILPARLHLVSRGIQTEKMCPLCFDFPEYTYHALWLCAVAQEVWSQSSLWHLLSQYKGITFMDLWCWVSSYGEGDDLGCFSMIAWSIWLNRNAFSHEGKFLSSSDVLSRAGVLWAQFLQCQPQTALTIHHLPSPSRWTAPPTGCIKINVDAAVLQGFTRVGIRVVVRDEYGIVLQSQYKCVEGGFSRHVAELLAAREGMLLASEHSWTQVILESDASNVINSINLINEFGDNESVISSIRVMGSKFTSFRALHCRRTANEVAHLLAARGLHGSFSFDDCSPLFISKYVLSDLVSD